MQIEIWNRMWSANRKTQNGSSYLLFCSVSWWKRTWEMWNLDAIKFLKISYKTQVIWMLHWNICYWLYHNLSKYKVTMIICQQAWMAFSVQIIKILIITIYMINWYDDMLTPIWIVHAYFLYFSVPLLHPVMFHYFGYELRVHKPPMFFAPLAYI